MTVIRICIVDDEPLAARTLERTLTAAGYDCRAFDDSQVACRAILADPPDIVLTDLRMPNMDGIALRAKVTAALGAGAPKFLLLTGTPPADEDEAAFSAVLVKPIQPDDLLEQLARLSSEEPPAD